MCSRYALTGHPSSIAATFKLAAIDPFPPRYDIAPTEPVGIVRMGHRGEREFVLVRWGLIPPWVKDARTFSTLINARAEGASTKPSFRGAMRHKRCLIPADAFYEWSGGAKGARRPHLVRRRDGGPMALAGLYESWLGADGSEIDTMAILTVPANGTVAPVHDRMPAILPPDQFDAWLDCRAVTADAAAELLRPAPDDLLEMIEIGPEIGNPRNDGPELQQPLRPRLL
ncbi:MAG: SOS response-associated peptidase [Hyphomicrobiaceae bacterium]